MAKKPAKTNVTLEFAFFNLLWKFYEEAKRGSKKNNPREHYKDLSKKYLDYNDPRTRSDAFLRRPQFEALEMYIFLKEFLDNQKIEKIFEDWYNQKGKFEGRIKGGFNTGTPQATLELGDEIELQNYEALLRQMKQHSRPYANYIFALTMGTGKTLLMATCIFYEFLLANKYPKDKHYCHNALIFAPDKTVLQSLREIEDFDVSKVVPKEYADLFASHLRFHFLDESGTSLSTFDGSRFNIVVSNTQKIILKRGQTPPTPASRLFQEVEKKYTSSIYDELDELYGFDHLATEEELKTNQRFEKLSRLPQLGIYVDEAHHAFGQNLAKDMGVGITKAQLQTSLRTTIDQLAVNLNKAGTHVVACYNYTGTPYIGKEVLPEVVYAFNLRDAINEKYLKLPKLHSYSNTRTQDFIKIVVKDFLEAVSGLQPEGLIPKLALFATSIEELVGELKPALEQELIAHNIPLDRILVNVGDDKITTNDDIRHFNNLDKPNTVGGTQKQFILLVNKGREGWNCRSLFGVAMYRSPKSKVFVLQATMRCLRAIGDIQYTGSVFLSAENFEILNNELQANFRMTVAEFNDLGDKEKIPPLQVRVRKDTKLTIKRLKRHVTLHEKTMPPNSSLGIDPDDKQAWAALTEPYQIIETQRTGMDERGHFHPKTNTTRDRSNEKIKTVYTPMTLVAEVSRYLNRSPLEVEELLSNTKEGLDKLVRAVNEFNELLYDVIIPRLFTYLYDTEENISTEEVEVHLIKAPKVGEKDYYEIKSGKGGTDYYTSADPIYRDKSFHLDTYTFDSKPEHTFFWDLLKADKIKGIYFTGMFTHPSKTEFFFQYIDPDSHTLRTYYPDFLMQREDGSYVIVEVKGDHQLDDPVVIAKQSAAHQVSVESGMEYFMVASTMAQNHNYTWLLEKGNKPVDLQSRII
ncbi:MAG: TnsA endonuclease N-terminal domain-containing protein [Thiofilum sp.]|uniref:TnsA endonuclease N-terminal domain-containing protein n=1 Tax=Thiofilum sp. TaxID=2212733 RepID=UPI0025E26D89|nr:TnsA endonuclease N-terminal domain-containing protein [Thiofilum sp.]MBK8454807.1 DEAD/DEAH box helicase family protein [Thiofilum sp.]